MDENEEKRLRQVEIDIATIQTRVGVIQAIVFSVIGLICSSVVVALVALVVGGKMT